MSKLSELSYELATPQQSEFSSGLLQCRTPTLRVVRKKLTSETVHLSGFSFTAIVDDQTL